MKKNLVVALRGKAQGKPVIVLGGGPSAQSDLEKIPGWRDIMQISANDHGFKIDGALPSLIFCKDHRRMLPRELSREPGEFLEPVMRAHGVPIVSQQYWADYRCAEWPIQGNSGMMALALAVFMGAAPAIAVGMDCFQGATYFHDPARPNVSNDRGVMYWQNRMKRLKLKLGVHECPIRGVSGIMASSFGAFKPTEAVKPHDPLVMFRYKSMTLVRLRMLRPIGDSATKTEIPAGVQFASYLQEANRLCRLGVAELDSPSRLM